MIGQNLRHALRLLPALLLVAVATACRTDREDAVDIPRPGQRVIVTSSIEGAMQIEGEFLGYDRFGAIVVSREDDVVLTVPSAISRIYVKKSPQVGN